MTVAGIIGWFINPIFSWVGGPLQAISDAIAKIPEIAVQAGLAILALVLAANWVRRFLNTRRTPAGLTQLTDDDRYSMVFAGFVGLAVAFVFLVLWPGLSSWLINSTSDLFGVLADKFGGDRSSTPFSAARPDITEGRFANAGPSGFNMSKGFAIIFISVWLNTAAFIGEVVRGGILAVSKGQTEAAMALGLRRSQALRQVILPQAFRVVLPPLGNQYLNLTKNTSLAFVVGFSDMFNTGSVLANQTGRVIPILVISMLFYLACSLTISTIVNFFNVRLKIVER
jgi:ABC-type amino acid transport system permease subunit